MLPCVFGLAATVLPSGVRAGQSAGGGQRAAGARTDRQARSLYREAEEHFKNERYSQAIGLYEAAYELRPLPGFLFNVGQCYRLLGDYVQAVVFFERYLGRYPRAPQRRQIERLLAEIRPKANHQQADERAKTAVAGRGQVRLATATGVAPPGGAPSPVDRVVADDRSRKLRRTVLLGSGIGLSAAFLVTGIVTGQLASDRADELEDPDTDPVRREELQDSGKALRTASIVTLSAAGVTAVATALYFWLGDSGSEPAGRSRSARVSATPLAGGGFLAVSGGF